jgi:hypothetical protein
MYDNDLKVAIVKKKKTDVDISRAQEEEVAKEKQFVERVKRCLIAL